MKTELCSACRNAQSNPCRACREGRPGSECTCSSSVKCTCGEAEQEAIRRQGKGRWLYWPKSP
jgi:hypothetical protein